MTSLLTLSCQSKGMTALRKTLDNGYDMEKETVVERLKKDMRRECRHRGWFSLKCTEWTSIQNLNQRTEQQIFILKKRRQKARKAVKNALKVITDGLDHKIPNSSSIGNGLRMHSWMEPSGDAPLSRRDVSSRSATLLARDSPMYGRTRQP